MSGVKTIVQEPEGAEGAEAPLAVPLPPRPAWWPQDGNWNRDVVARMGADLQSALNPEPGTPGQERSLARMVAHGMAVIQSRQAEPEFIDRMALSGSGGSGSGRASA